VNFHLSKLEDLGWIERLGNRRCPFQAYRITRNSEPSVHRALEHGLDLFKRHPRRIYFLFSFATRPSYYGGGGGNGSLLRFVMPGRPGGCSVPFGVHLPVVRSEGVEVLLFSVPHCELDVDMFFEVWDDCDFVEQLLFSERSEGSVDSFPEEPVEEEVGSVFEW
jgi:hypothetical protein